MEVVANHLKAHALQLESQASLEDASLFGRSAFNRFYYAAFLLVKKQLKPVFPDLPSKHASIPQFLRGTVERELRRRKGQARKVGDHPSAQLAYNARIAALELADLLALGYGARVNADYHPEIPVSFYERGFKLNEVRISEAESWPHKAGKFSATISDAMRQTNAY